MVGAHTPVFSQPIDLIAKTTAVAKREKDGEALNLPGHPVWLGRQDSNLGMAESKSPKGH